MRYLSIILTFVPFILSAQVEMNKTLEFTGTSSSDKQIRNLNSSLDSTNGVTAVTYQKGSIQYAESSIFSSDSVYLSMNQTIGAYKNGLQINFFAPSTNNDSVYANVNNLGWIKLVYNNKNIASKRILSGQAIQMIYDNGKFHIINNLEKQCPSNFVEVNQSYCIEKNEHSSAGFFAAINVCSTNNARLCTWAEWYYACQKSGLGLTNMNNNYEWIDSATNSTNQVTIVGTSTCTAKSIALNSTIQFYRCCYSK